MHKKQVDIIKTQILQTRLETLLYSRVVRAPQFGRDENILSFHFPILNSGRNTLADLFLVLVAERRVDVPVPHAQSMADSSGNLAFIRLPCTCFIANE